MTGSGERLDPGTAPSTHDEHAHLARYLWVAERAQGAVLDVACGTGYGSALLVHAHAVATVTGIDRFPAAVEEAAQSAPSATIICASVPPLPFDDGAFDSVVSLETIEHIEDDRAFAQELRRVLCPGGTLLLSTPNAEATSPEGVVQNPWHVREYRLNELLALLHGAGFEQCEVFGQQIYRTHPWNLLARKLLARFPRLCRAERWWDRLGHGSRRIEPWRGAGLPIFWVVHCR